MKGLLDAGREAELKPLGMSAGDALPGDRQLLADLFHALSQPLTALRCSLELALDPRRSAEQCREGGRTALAYAEQVSRLCGGIRMLADADDLGDDLQMISLGDCLREMVDTMRPLAEAHGGSLILRDQTAAARVRCGKQRLRHGVFSLLEYALQGCRAPARIELAAGWQADGVGLVLTVVPNPRAEKIAAAKAEEENPLQRRLALAVARRIFHSAGGSLQVRNGGENLRLEVRLPAGHGGEAENAT
jgi:signal transduction histidine kinase